MLEQCKLKAEDFEKFKKDKIQAEVLNHKKEISRMTLRSKAAKTIENISSSYFRNLIYYREVPNRSVFCIEKSIRTLFKFKAKLGGTVNFFYH
jgi:hypothetical protein